MDSALLREQNRFLAGALAGKKILVSGATGLLGSRLVARIAELNDLWQAGIRAVGLYRREEKKNRMFPGLPDREDILFRRYAVGAPPEPDREVDAVIHCAGITGGSKMHLRDPLEVFRTGLEGTGEMLEFAAASGCPDFVYVSTYEVYGDGDDGVLIGEQDACRLDTFTLRNCYGEIKRLCESLCCAYMSKYGMNVCAARLTSTFGKGVAYRDPRFFAEFARCVIEGRDIVLKSGGGTVRSYLDADDAAGAFLYLLAGGKSGNAYNVTNLSNTISVRDLALKMIRLSGKPLGLRYETGEDISALGFRKEGTTLLDGRKMEGLGWKPVYTLDETLGKMIRYMRTEQNDL